MNYEPRDAAREWLAAKAEEAQAVKRRRSIENFIVEEAGLSEQDDGTTTIEDGIYTIKIVSRIDRKVDADMAQELAAEHGMEPMLSVFFRWKPELNLSAWKAATQEQRTAFARSITAKPGRPSFSVTTKEEVQE